MPLFNVVTVLLIAHVKRFGHLVPQPPALPVRPRPAGPSRLPGTLPAPSTRCHPSDRPGPLNPVQCPSEVGVRISIEFF